MKVNVIKEKNTQKYFIVGRLVVISNIGSLKSVIRLFRRVLTLPFARCSLDAGLGLFGLSGNCKMFSTPTATQRRS